MSNHRKPQQRSHFSSRTERIWIAPSASKSTRKLALKSKASVRGAFVNPNTNREIFYESTLERDLAQILLAHPDVKDVHEQPNAVTYVDPDGVIKKHTFDFVAHLKDGTRTAIAVKPARKVATSEIAETVDRISKQAPEEFADRFVVRTGDHITRNRAANARLILKARRMRDADAIAEVAQGAVKIRGAMRIADLLAATRNDGHGFMAVVFLIGDGVLEHVGPGRISHESSVRPARASTCTH